MKKIVIGIIGIIDVLLILSFIYLFTSFNKHINDDDKMQNFNIIAENNTLNITYKTETYEKKTSDGKTSIINERNLPVIENNNESTKNMVNYLENISNNEWNELTNMSDELIKAFEENNTDTDIIGVKYIYSTNVLNDNYVTFLYTTTGGLGGVSWNDEKGYNFNIENGKILGFDDICNEPNIAKKEIYNYTISYLQSQDYVSALWNSSYEGKWEEIVKDNLFKEGIWYFTPTSISFSLPKYLIGPGYLGVINIDIDLTNINQYIKEEYKIKN